MAKKKNFQDTATLELLQDAPPTTPAVTKTTPQYIFEVAPETFETKSKRVQLLIQPSLLEFVKEEAEKRRISMNEYICRLISKEKNMKI